MIIVLPTALTPPPCWHNDCQAPLYPNSRGRHCVTTCVQVAVELSEGTVVGCIDMRLSRALNGEHPQVRGPFQR